MNKKSVLIVVVIMSLFTLAISSVSAQQGRGPGGRGGNANPPVDNPLQNQNNNTWGNQQSYGGRWGNQAGVQNRGAMQGQFFYGYELENFVAEGELSDAAYDIIVAGLQDEYNAYTFYGSVIDQFGPVNPFVNIQRAELQHINSLEYVLEAYDISVPTIVVGDMPLFASVSEACQAAADAEVANFGLYDEMIDGLVDYPAIQNIVISLRDASEFSHLPAFENCAAR